MVDQPKKIKLELTEQSYRYLVETLRQNVFNAGFLVLRELEEQRLQEPEIIGRKLKADSVENVIKEEEDNGV